MRINLVPDSSIASAPAGLAAAVEAAASIFDQEFPGHYTVNISYGWGTMDNEANPALTNPDSAFSLGGFGDAPIVSYSQLKSWLTADATTSAQMTAVASLPASDAALPGGANSFMVSSAEEKALGVFSGDSGALDGSIGFNVGDATDSDLWEPAALCEIIHALGWASIAENGTYPSAADLFRYSSPGQYQWTSGQPAYFSVDGGNTDLADFSLSFDQTLFTDLPAEDPMKYLFTSSATTLTSFDIEALSVIGFTPATTVTYGSENLGVVNTSWRIAATGDFNDVGEDGILWRDTTNGGVELWNSNGSGGFTYESLGAVNPSWEIAGIGDFTGNGQDGVLWRNTDGSVELWNSNGSGGFTYENLGVINSSWRVAGTGDFTGGGEDGILWRNANGSVELWNSNGSGGFAYENLGVVNSNWQLAGTGDFTGNGADGILWRNTNGDVELWNANGSGGFAYENLGVVNANWRIAGTGDFTGNGADGILWRDTNGDVELWNGSGSGGFTYQNLGAVNPSWQIAGTGDFTGNGADGILWRNTNGGVELWNPIRA